MTETAGAAGPPAGPPAGAADAAGACMAKLGTKDGASTDSLGMSTNGFHSPRLRTTCFFVSTSTSLLSFRARVIISYGGGG